MPYLVALINEDNGRFVIIDTIMDILFVFDILIHLNSPIEEKTGIYNCHRKTIFMKYLKGWFFIDLIASAPLKLI